MATIKDIAKAAGVSIATVSRVINDLGGYSDDTCQKVKAVAKELNYTKNSLARSLVRKRSQIIGVIMPTVPTSFSNPIIEGIEEVAEQLNFDVIISHTGSASKYILQKIIRMNEFKVDGLIIISSQLSQVETAYLEKNNIKTILVSTMVPDSDLPYIKVDDYSAMYAITNYLVSIGHRKIGLAGPNLQDKVAGQPRFAGYKKALIDAGIKFQDEWIQTGVFDFTSGREAVRNYLKDAIDISCICCVSDECALGAISEAAANNIVIPRELSITGYDGTSLAKMVSPTLTTIKQPFFEMGIQSCSELIACINDGKVMKSQLLNFSLELGQTTKEKRG